MLGILLVLISTGLCLCPDWKTETILEIPRYGLCNIQGGTRTRALRGEGSLLATD